MTRPSWLQLSAGVAEALNTEGPVVALESTLICHGLPQPRNLETALALEQDVRAGGAVPATVAVIDGRLRVGLEEHEIERLAQAGSDARKLSSRGLGPALAERALGATTVAGTLVAADLAGIRVFATGGIGGVHHGAELSFDVSADLLELSRRPVAVICAGAKAILDIARTLEILETLAVPLIGYQTDDFPAFYSRSSGFAVGQRCESSTEVARNLEAHWDLGLAGALVANPVPAEHEVPPQTLEPIVAQALEDARGAAITGQQVTPFLLERVTEASGGTALEANVALIRSNARLAAQIARALHRH